jgi:hypothetical protein
MKTCYYARSINLYGTEEDKRNIVLLRWLGFQVADPNKQCFHDVYPTMGMEVFYQYIDECDLLAFKALPDGSIPAGVANEIGHARLKHKPVFEIPGAINRRTLSVENTREYLRDVGAR